MTIPITVFTGFLGAGKTSVIISLLPKLPKDYKVVLLKNEFGDVEVDSKLAQQSSLTAVSEILNGCMCCVLVGQMQNALIEIRDKFHPDRIFIECSGSAFPATLAFQIRQLERDTNGDFKLDAIVTVVDAENFVGYEDTSPTARMQASYSDIILINKWENVSERELDVVMDHLYTLNDATPKIRCQGRDGVDPKLLFGLETKLFTDVDSCSTDHHEEVETVSVVRSDEDGVEEDVLVNGLSKVSKGVVWRVKGFVRRVDGWVIVNWAFGRCEVTGYGGQDLSGSVRLTVMGERGEVARAARALAGELGANMIT